MNTLCDVKQFGAVGDGVTDDAPAIQRALDEAVNTLRGYVNDISAQLGKVASQDLSIEITQEYLGDFAPIKASLSNIADSLNSVIGSIKNSADQVASGSVQVAQGAQRRLHRLILCKRPENNISPMRHAPAILPATQISGALHDPHRRPVS